MKDFVSSKDRIEAFAPSRRIPCLDICENCDERRNSLASFVLFMIGIALGIVLLATLRACDRLDPQPTSIKSHVSIERR